MRARVAAQVTKGWDVSVVGTLKARMGVRGGEGEGPWPPETDAAKRREGGKRQKPFD